MSNEVGNRLIGRRIEAADVDGHGIEIRFTDGSIFCYMSSDGGYSSFSVYETEEEYLAEE